MPKKLLTKENLNELSTRISALEREVSVLKRYFKFLREESEEKIGKKIKPVYEKIQERIFKERYPELYAKIKKKK
jgi:archaellum component FlaC